MKVAKITKISEAFLIVFLSLSVTLSLQAQDAEVEGNNVEDVDTQDNEEDEEEELTNTEAQEKDEQKKDKEEERKIKEMQQKIEELDRLAKSMTTASNQQLFDQDALEKLNSIRDKALQNDPFKSVPAEKQGDILSAFNYDYLNKDFFQSLSKDEMVLMKDVIDTRLSTHMNSTAADIPAMKTRLSPQEYTPFEAARIKLNASIANYAYRKSAARYNGVLNALKGK